MEQHSIIDKVKKLVTPLFEQKGVELVEMTYRQEGRQMVLRFLVDKVSGPGITLDECAALNEEIGAILDKDDTIATFYLLEVSSPGLDRSLVTKEDFGRVVSKKMEILLKDPLEGKFSYTGKLHEVKENSIILRKETSRDLIEIPLDIINKGKLKIEFQENRFQR